jgi:signal transduction histidine kinase
MFGKVSFSRVLGKSPPKYLIRLLVGLIFLSSLQSMCAEQALTKKNVLIVTEVGPSHALSTALTQRIVAEVEEAPSRHVEFYLESLDLLTAANGPSLPELKNWLVKKYGQQKIDAIVAIGPEAIRFLAENKESMFPGVPIVICGSSEEQAGKPNLDSRFTGTWTEPDPVRTLESAFRLFPETRQVYVVGGSSVFDRRIMAMTKDALGSFAPNTKIFYLSDMRMGELLDRLKQLPEHSVVLYLSFFEDSAGDKFLNATKALPMVVAAANAPVFGMSDTYLGHGIVGGEVMSFRDQGNVTARIVSELLGGKNVEDVAIRTLPSVYMFDWKELQRWHISETSLPPQSVVLFHEASVWERTKWTWMLVFSVMFFLAALAMYLQHSRKQLELARERQRRLSGMLINAEEQERSRVATELHDDFSQRLAVLALKLENVAEAVSPLSKEADQQLHELLSSASELGADLHTLSHRLHSATLEKLGLVPGIRALCKEFSFQTGLNIGFSAEGIPNSVSPEVALCIFRIVQEALRNVKKHSGATSAEVKLVGRGEKLRLFVCDEGNGFEIRELQARDGLGICSMEERVLLLGGEFAIHSARGSGTTVEASVPLAARVGIAKGDHA